MEGRWRGDRGTTEGRNRDSRGMTEGQGRYSKPSQGYMKCLTKERVGAIQNADPIGVGAEMTDFPAPLSRTEGGMRRHPASGWSDQVSMSPPRRAAGYRATLADPEDPLSIRRKVAAPPVHDERRKGGDGLTCPDPGIRLSSCGASTRPKARGAGNESQGTEPGKGGRCASLGSAGGQLNPGSGGGG